MNNLFILIHQIFIFSDQFSRKLQLYNIWDKFSFLFLPRSINIRSLSKRIQNISIPFLFIPNTIFTVSRSFN